MDVAGIQAKLLDSDHLAADQFPEVRLEAVAIQPETGGGLLARARVTIRGITREIELPVHIERSRGRLILSGSLPILQRDFGIEPESIGGMVKVSNEVDLHFRLTATASSRACSAAAG